uniref:Uncharacterized protein n=1 Tax=Romanomermis culicivorax TaxID=13658 RepID=A0A915KUV4_ROMCU
MHRPMIKKKPMADGFFVKMASANNNQRRVLDISLNSSVTFPIEAGYARRTRTRINPLQSYLLLRLVSDNGGTLKSATLGRLIFGIDGELLLQQ